jgi:hypothetical protein
MFLVQWTHGKEYNHDSPQFSGSANPTTARFIHHFLARPEFVRGKYNLRDCEEQFHKKNLKG